MAQKVLAATTRLRPSSSSSSPIYTALARLTKRNSSHRLLSSSSRNTTSKAKSKPILLLLILFLLVVAVVVTVLLFPALAMSSSSASSAVAAGPLENPRAVVKKVLAESQPEGQGATVRRSIGRYDANPTTQIPTYLYLPWRRGEPLLNFLMALTSLLLLACCLQARAPEPGPFPHARRVLRYYRHCSSISNLRSRSEFVQFCFFCFVS